MCVSTLLKHTVGPQTTIKVPKQIFRFMGSAIHIFFTASYECRTAMKKILVKKRHSIRKSQATDLLARLTDQIGPSASLFHADMIEVIETNANISLFLVDKKPHLMDNGTWVFPTLKGAVQVPFPERRVVVDAGAIPYVVNGADVMRPGIVSVTPDVKAGLPVQIVEERHGKPLAIGIALHDAAEISASTAGKMCKSLQHVGDEFWNLEL